MLKNKNWYGIIYHKPLLVGVSEHPQQVANKQYVDEKSPRLRPESRRWRCNRWH